MASILHSASKGVDAKAEFTPAVIVGIDIGTARSGYSYAFVKRPNEIVCEQQNNSTLKQLTAVLLRASDLSFVAFGEAAQKEYLEIDPVKQAADFLYFEKFKMVLYGDDIKERPSIPAANGQKVPSVDVFAAALRYFKDKAMKRLKEAANSLVAESEVQWVVTVPAIWSPGAKQLMREAAKKAGLFDKIEAQLVLALESEAASLCCRERELQVNASQWKAGLRYMVVDLGGGTADVTVHKVTEQQTLGEVVESGGGAWGSVYIEKEFVRLLEKIFGEKVITSYWSGYPLDAIELMNDFERLKTGVSVSDNKPKRLHLPMTFMAHVQQQTGKSVESHCANFALAYKPSSPKPAGAGDLKDHKEGAATPSATAAAPAGINFLDLQSQPPKPVTPSSSGSGGFTSSLLSHLMPGYASKPAAAPAPATPAASAAPAAPAQKGTEADAKSAAAAAAAGPTIPHQQKKLEEWVFVGSEMPSAPGGIPASDACVSFSRGYLKFAPDLMLSLFDGVVKSIVAHVNGVLAKVGVVSHIFMAGGFSDSDVVRHAFDQAIGPRGIRIITPPHVGLAVLSGAVLYGLRPKVVSSRIVKRTYGVAVSCEWQPKRHESRKPAHRLNNAKKVAFCDGIFSPFCLAGEELKVDYSVSQCYTPGEDNQECMVLKIYQSNSRNVTYIDAPDASLAAQMTLPMPDMTGNLQRKVRVTMVFGSTEIRVSAVDETSGQQTDVTLSFLDRGFEGAAKVVASA